MLAAGNDVFKTHKRSKFRIIQLSKVPDQVPRAFEETVADLLLVPDSVVFNCFGVKSLPEIWIDTIGLLERQLKENGKRLQLLFVDENLEEQIRQSRWGKYLHTSSSYIESLEEIIITQIEQKKPHFIRVFVNALIRVLYIQGGLIFEHGNVFFKEAGKDQFEGDVTSSMSFKTTEYTYSISISFPKDTFLVIVEKLLGEKFTEISAANKDAAAEVLNMVFGQAKIVLNRYGSKVQPQLPVINLRDPSNDVFPGFNFGNGETHTIASGKTLVLPFQSKHGKLFIEVWVAKGSENALFTG